MPVPLLLNILGYANKVIFLQLRGNIIYLSIGNQWRVKIVIPPNAPFNLMLYIFFKQLYKTANIPLSLFWETNISKRLLGAHFRLFCRKWFFIEVLSLLQNKMLWARQKIFYVFFIVQKTCFQRVIAYTTNRRYLSAWMLGICIYTNMQSLQHLNIQRLFYLINE